MKKIYNLQDIKSLFAQDRVKKYRVAVLGGTFNPAHVGHLMISKRALSYYQFDYVIWLVAQQNPLKPITEKNIFERANQAVEIIDEPKIIVSTIEYDFATQYMYDSMSNLISLFPNIEFTWMMGMDNVANFSKWYRSTDIPKLCDIIIFDRDCKERLDDITKFGLKPSRNLRNNKQNKIIIDRNKLYNISSTQIRGAAKEV